MEGFLNCQKDLTDRISRAFINFKKSPKDRISASYVETRLDNLEQLWVEFITNHHRIIKEFNWDECQKSIYFKTNVYDQVEECYIDYKCVLKEHSKSFNSQVQTVTDSNAEFRKGNCISSSSVQLPKITIPTFSGVYTEWVSFRDMFVSLIHSNSSLDNVQKLHYLKGHLTGEAEQLVRYIPVTDSNYLQCWNKLETRYNNKKYLSNCIFKRLFTQKRILSESPSALKDLLDTTLDCIDALNNIKIDVSTWDPIIIYIIAYKLDPETRKQWELKISSDENTELPTLQQFKSFIESRFRALECVESKRAPVQHNGSRTQKSHSKVMLSTNTSNSSSVLRCEYCSDGHKLCFCRKFIALDVGQKRQFVIKNKMCSNCLGGNHATLQCQKLTCCHICKKRHHTLLHISSAKVNHNEYNNAEVKPSTSSDSTDNLNKPEPFISCHSISKLTSLNQVLLATALVKVQSMSSDYQIVRALLDQGSQASFITEATVQFLRLKKTPVKGTVSGLGDNKTIVSRSMVYLKLKSITDPDFEIEVNAYVLKNITSYLPERKLQDIQWVELEQLQLADPQFNHPSKINVLLGADVYSRILKDGVKRAPVGSLVAQCTSLGWILSGVVNSEIIDKKNSVNKSQSSKVTVMHAQINENELIKQFWEIEDQFNTNKILTVEEQRCEENFVATTNRTKDGRYVVTLPFRDEKPLCIGGNSRNVAVNRLKTLERKMKKNPDLKEKYTEVIHEYLTLNHMKEVKVDDESKAVYLPHHAVIRADKTTSKVRVVFDASCKNENNVSLNDCLMIGPTLQSDLRHIVLRWRTHPIGIVADILKMYRQVRVDEMYSPYQRIVWRDNPEEEIKDYELITVTFGTASAPYLAVRALHQVAIDEGKNYPLAAERVPNSFYVDDLMTGCATLEEGKVIYEEFRNLLNKGGFVLQKWNTNNQTLLRSIEISENERQNVVQGKDEVRDKSERSKQVNIKESKEKKDICDTTKILGLTWSPCSDVFSYSVQLPPKSGPVTKRSILSDIARLYDPLGWIAPTVVIAKVMIQKLWLTGLGWDDEVPTVLKEEWDTYRVKLGQLTEIRIPRWIGMTGSDACVELHGFSDASKMAYSAVVYIRTMSSSGDVRVFLLTAKTKVAPIKQVTIPRLELCGAVLLARLLLDTAQALNIPKNTVHAWTDSTVVLAWLNSHPSKWKTFVANRVSEILTTLDAEQWAHVSTKNNPADIASRGVLPSSLKEQGLWFEGPQFLRSQTITYDRPKNLDSNLEKNVKSHVTVATAESEWNNFSNLKRLLRVVAYCRRFINLKDKQDRTKYLKGKEIEEALKCCIRECQKREFKEEYMQLKNTGCIRSKISVMKSLCPYLGEDDIIRVGGRLQQSSLPDRTKHPIILPHSDHLTKLVVADAHDRTLHGGPQLMLNYLRTSYWIVRAKSLVKQHVRNCVICVKHSAKHSNQLMGPLPSVRCNPSRPFLHSGVDYAGPISIRTTKGRGHHAYKGYICLFVCMATRAIHLEAVSDMSTQAFLAAFRRFVSRRGQCAQIWSDNGTNFVGAARELKELSSLQQNIAEHLESVGTEWHFIPPHAPNFGGLWEAAVKSTKFHLKRVIGDSTLTYEELSTLLGQIEACLNSRPMTVIVDNDKDAPLPLTPGHFLVGGPLLAVPDVNYQESSINLLTRWQLVQRMLQNFWQRWSSEYLTTLLQRYKWSRQIPEPQIGDIVLVKESDLPPTRWLLGRIVQKHVGSDNITRVVTLRTEKSVLKRPTSKLCILPVN